MDESDSNHSFEISSLAGVVYIYIDKQPMIIKRFKEYIKAVIVLDGNTDSDKHINVQKTEETESTKPGFDTPLPFQYRNLLADFPGDDTQETSAELGEDGKQKDCSVSPCMGRCKEQETSMHADKRSVKRKHQKGLRMQKNRSLKTREIKKQKETTNVTCKYCAKSFKSQQEFYDHRKSNREEHSCDLCLKIFPFKAHLLVHKTSHNNLSFADLQNTFADGLLQPSQEIKTKTSVKPCAVSLKCEICGAIMSNSSVLKTHVMIHTGESAYKCCVCSQQFNSIGGYTHHMRSHAKSGKVLCKICNIGFESRSELSKHQLMHEYKCNLCGAFFPNKTSRAFHYRVSHKEDILKCSECDKMFSSDTELKTHLKYHKNRKKTQCTVCGRLVSRLQDHMSSHANKLEECGIFYCDKCPKQFRQKLCFQRHLKTHSEEKVYVCIYCPKKFARSGGLSRHMLTHSQDRSFMCPVCGKTFTQMNNLKGHMQVHNDKNFESNIV